MDPSDLEIRTEPTKDVKSQNNADYRGKWCLMQAKNRINASAPNSAFLMSIALEQERRQNSNALPDDTEIEDSSYVINFKIRTEPVKEEIEAMEHVEFSENGLSHEVKKEETSSCSPSQEQNHQKSSDTENLEPSDLKDMDVKSEPQEEECDVSERINFDNQCSSDGVKAEKKEDAQHNVSSQDDVDMDATNCTENPLDDAGNVESLKEREIKSESEGEERDVPEHVRFDNLCLSYDIKTEKNETAQCNVSSQDEVDMDAANSTENPLGWPAQNACNVSWPSTSGLHPLSQEKLKVASEEQFSDTRKKVDYSSGSDTLNCNNSDGKPILEAILKPYRCEFCAKTFSQPSNLKIHLRSHTKERPFLCEICNKGCTTPSDLKVHIRIHTNEKPYRCDVCNSSFAQSSTLKKHMKIHTKIKSYRCDVCNKAFVQSSSVKKHMKLHTKEKHHRCGICGRAFTEAYDLKVHMRVHTKEKPFSCEVCSKKFRQSSSLKVHLRSHTKQKPHCCQICGKAFSTASDFKVHFRIHTKEKPYQCEICLEVFPRLSTMKKHLQTHTENSDA